MIFEQIAYKGWETCYRLSDGRVELIITGEVGPRIIHFGLLDQENILHQVAEDMGESGGDDFRLYGGHRLWHAPEVKPRTYQADNQAIDHFELNDVYYFVPPVETETGIQKQLSISFQDETVVVDHTLTNVGLWAIELAPWALTLMRTGGTSIIPLPPHTPHSANLLPTHALTLWGYSSLNDPRLRFSDRYIRVDQTTDNTQPLKIGLRVTPDLLWSVGWLAYIHQQTMFVKSFHAPAEGHLRYPDLDTQIEIYTDHRFLELETMGTMHLLQSDETITHREYWSLHGQITPPNTDADIGQVILPLIREAHPTVGRRSGANTGE